MALTNKRKLVADLASLAVLLAGVYGLVMVYILFVDHIGEFFAAWLMFFGFVFILFAAVGLGRFIYQQPDGRWV